MNKRLQELDPVALAEIAELSKASGRNVLRRLVDRFLAELSTQASLTTAALESGNMDQLATVMHTLRSPSAIVGAKQFSDICAHVERYARGGKVDQATALARELLEAAQLLPNVLLAAAGDS
jgi:HPt (histidine-containing phosphotransfer) domain-containing protein